MKRILIIFFGLIAIVGLTCVAAVHSVNTILSRVPEDELWRITDLGRVRESIVSGDFLLFETHNGKDCHCVFAADKLTGQLVWSTEDLAAPFIEEFKRESPDSTQVPAFVALYATNDEHGIVYIILNYTLYALDRFDGDVLWGGIEIHGSHYAEDAYVEYANDVLYVLSKDGSLLKLDAVTGNPHWNMAILRDETNSAYLELYESNIFVVAKGSGIESVLAFDASDGKKLWTTEIDSALYGNLFTGEILLAGTSGSGWDDDLPIAAFELVGGTNVWNTLFEEKGRDEVFPSIVEDRLFLVIDKQNIEGINPSKLVVMNSKTGAVLWEFNQAFHQGKITYYVSGEIVYVGTQTGYLLALNIENGDEIWKIKSPASPTCFAEESGLIIVISENSSLFAFERETGIQKWFLNLEIDFLDQDCFESSRRVKKENGYIYLVSNDRIVHAIDIRTGEESWSWYDRRFPAWRLIPINKGYPLLGPIDGNTIYIYSGGIFALDVSK